MGCATLIDDYGFRVWDVLICKIDNLGKGILLNYFIHEKSISIFFCSLFISSLNDTIPELLLQKIRNENNFLNNFFCGFDSDNIF